MSKLTPSQRHALLLLDIQDAKRGWVREGVLRHCGVQNRTLMALTRHSMGLVEMDMPTEANRRYDWRWRLTGRGEREAARLKALGWEASATGTKAVTDAATHAVTKGHTQ